MSQLNVEPFQSKYRYFVSCNLFKDSNKIDDQKFRTFNHFEIVGLPKMILRKLRQKVESPKFSTYRKNIFIAFTDGNIYFYHGLLEILLFQTSLCLS